MAADVPPDHARTGIAVDPAVAARPRPGATTRSRVTVVEDGGPRRGVDALVTEEPLEVRVAAGTGAARATRTVAVTMRTPGADFALAVGFLHGEGVVRGRGDVRRVAYCADADLPAGQRYNVVTVDLAVPTLPPARGLDRTTVTSSACGVCGADSVDAVLDRLSRLDRPVAAGEPPGHGRGDGRGRDGAPVTVPVDVEVLYGLPDRLRAAQRVFDRTGGLHAAGLFLPDGTLVDAAEDVGRHNAVDKLVGGALLDGRTPLDGHVLVVSGRAGFEIVQKAAAAGVDVVCAVSAPTSLAVNLARRAGTTLVGFLRGRRCVVYAGAVAT